MNFSFNLNSKHGKFTCPNCGHKKRFVRYVNDRGEFYPDPTVGRCDRINSCGYWKKPVPDQNNNNNLYKKSDSNVLYKKHIYLDYKYVMHTNKYVTNSKLYTFLSNIFGKKNVFNMLNLYKIGRYKNYDTIPYIDLHGNIATIQCKLFDDNLHTVKNTWLHNLVKNTDMDNYKNNDKFVTCFFGEHLLQNNNYNYKYVCIAEAPKTAIVCSLANYLPQAVWLASFNCTGLTEEKFDRIVNIYKDKTFILFPDTSPDGHVYKDWGKFALSYKSKKKVNIFVDDFLEKNLPKDKRDKGYDLADYILENINNNN